MPGVAGHAETGDFGINGGAATQGVPIFLHDQNGRAFAHHESIAGGVERTGGRAVFFIVGREGVGRIETADARNGDRRFGTAGDHDVGAPQLDLRGGRQDGVRRRGAGR